MNATIITDIPKSDVLSSLDLANGAKHHTPPAHRYSLAYALADVLLACVGGLLAYHVRFSSNLLRQLAFLDHFKTHESGPAAAYFGFLLLYVVLVALACHAHNLYRPAFVRSPLNESLLVARAVFISTLVLAAFIYLTGIQTVSRLVVGLNSTLSVFALASWRVCHCYLMRKLRAQGHGLQHALIVGAGTVGHMLAAQLEQNPDLGYQVKGFLDQNHNGELKVLGDIEDLPRIAREEFVDDVFITIPSERELVKKVALDARRLHLNVKVVSELYDGLAWLSPIEFVGGFPVRILHREPIPASGLLIKSLVDILGSALGLILLSPILVTIALAIKIDSPGPIIYRAFRVGRKGRRFLCYKFRTMVANADEVKEQLRTLNEREGPFFKIAQDPRITTVGLFLRKYSLDELPQLWNVLKGDMSLVGPRPHPLDDFEQYTLEHLRRLDVTPGVTCLWQVDARHDPSFETALELDTQYIENWSLLLDLKILLKTIPVVIRGTGH